MLYNTLSNLSNGLGSEIDSYTYWLNSKSSPIQRLNNLSARIESRVLSKGETNPDYTHLEALAEICEEENLELSTLRNNLSKSILQKIEANGLNSKRLKGTRTSLPL
jgi:hypothetical protein